MLKRFFSACAALCLLSASSDSAPARTDSHELSVPITVMLIKGGLCGTTPFSSCEAVISCGWTQQRADTGQVVGRLVLELALGQDGTGDLVISDPLNGIQYLDIERKGALDGVSVRGVTHGFWPVSNLQNDLRAGAQRDFVRDLHLMLECVNQKSRYPAI